MKKLLILQNEISSYNVETYNEIAQEFELTLGYLTKDKSSKICKFSKKHLSNFNIGPFTFVRKLRSYCESFDIVCILPNLHIPSYCLIPFLPHKYKVVSWSIGFRCSYIHPYVTNRKHDLLDNIFKLILAKCDANIFYMDKAKEFWKDTSLRMDNVFVAPNTTDVIKIEFNPSIKRDFLFVGTLYQEKGVELLIGAFDKFKFSTESDTRLIIVGDGDMRPTLENVVLERKLGDCVKFTGAIYNEEILSDYFAHSLLCFSPKQAGLTVTKSMGYGVPFVTKKDSITGGELYHIREGYNGILYSNDEQLFDIMMDSAINRDKYVEMGRRAREYYFSHATIKHMANGAILAFK